QALFSEASLFLHQATRGLVFFKDVTIAVPPTWPWRQEAEVTESSLFNVANIRVAEQNPVYKDTPYTLQPRSCGELGEYIHVTPAFLCGLNGTTAQRYGSPAYHLVHEWAHYRYGIFDEYGTTDDHWYPSLYCENGSVRANTCSDRIRFTASTANGEPCRVYRGCRVSTKCKPEFYQDTRNPVESSVMFMPYIPGMSKFCDDSGRLKHNIFAPSKHNHMCQWRSTWDVISENADFQNLGNPVPQSRVQVAFREVQQRSEILGKVVMALDVSTSMRSKRLALLKSAATHFIRHLIPNGIELGIVVFSSDASTIRNLTPVNDAARAAMVQSINALPASGSTCIGCALKRSIEVLKYGGRTAEGDTIILMTDGEENQYPRINNVLPLLLREKVVVNTLALGRSAEKTLEHIALKTGGKAFWLQDRDNSEMAFGSALLVSTTAMLDDAHRPIVVLDLSLKVGACQSLTFPIDPELGYKMKVIIAGTSSNLNGLDVQLRDPTDDLYNKNDSPSVAPSSNWLTLEIRSPAMPGTWNLTLKSTASAEMVVSVRITSMAKEADDHPIRLRTFLNMIEVSEAKDARIYSEVSKGPHAVLHAKVWARVMTPLENTGQVIVELFDDGVGADSTANDGIYSAFFTQFEGKGRYSVVTEVVDGGSAIIAKGRRASGGLPVTKSSAGT
ncbi:unnamed protein product, partial [Ixodes hexagonus]